jgi:hypothetical protein
VALPVTAAVDVPGLPAWPSQRLHLVATRASCQWTIHTAIDGQGRYQDTAVVFDEPPWDEDPDTWRAREQDAEWGIGAVDLRPYGADLIYCNGHIQLTPGVVGTVGGPPLGMYPNPCCTSCHRLMFHVATIENRIREYGDGWRSLFLCEQCGTVACQATGWN